MPSITPHKRHDLTPIDATLRFVSEVHSSTETEVPYCLGDMSISSLGWLYRHYGPGLFDPRIREYADLLAGALLKKYRGTTNWKQVGNDKNQIWMICDNFEQVPTSPPTTKVNVQGLRIVAGGEFVIATASFLPHLMNGTNIHVRVHKMPSTHPAINSLIFYGNQQPSSADLEALRIARAADKAMAKIGSRDVHVEEEVIDTIAKRILHIDDVLLDEDGAKDEMEFYTFGTGPLREALSTAYQMGAASQIAAQREPS